MFTALHTSPAPKTVLEKVARCGMVVLCVTAAHGLDAQTTPGRLFRTAVNATQLDPNGDGWISATPDGFSALPDILDESQEFETEWEPLWHFEMEPNSDLQTGSDCGPTEIVDNPNQMERAGYWKVIDPDGTPATEDELLLFRIRINSDPNNAAYGYSFLLDTDLKFGTTGLDADPNAMSGNPGFEFEILFASGNAGGVYVNKVDGVAAHNQITVYQSYADGVNDQRSYARFSNCAPSTPVFIDFFVAFADFGAEILSNSSLRMLFATASSANSALNGSASDIGGINDANYPDDDAIFEAFISAVPVIQFSEGYFDTCPGAPELGGIAVEMSTTTRFASDGTATLSVTSGSPTSLNLTGINGAPNYTFALPGPIDGIAAGLYTVTAMDDDGCTSNALTLMMPYALCCDCGVSDLDTDGICDDEDNCTDKSAPNYDDPANTPCAE